MKATISEINGNYRVVFIPEDNNDQLLLELLTDTGKAPFSNQEDGTIVIVKAKEQAVIQPSKGKRTVSLSARRKMALAQRARWQKLKAGRPVSKKKSGISPAGRARIAAAARARWARIKAVKRNGKPKLVKKVA